MPTDTLDRPKSQHLFDTIEAMVPGGANSPVRSFKGLDIAPMIVEKGAGDTIWDVDGNSYIDFCCSWGPLIHGHCHPTIVTAANVQIHKGSSFGITTPAEANLAKIILKHVPSVEKIRFVSSGTEATMSAARLARGYTGRDLIVKFIGNYHGHADFFLVQAGSGVLGLNATSSSAGIPDDIVKHTVCLPYNDCKALSAFLTAPENRSRIAGVIIEPIAGNMGCVPATKEFLELLRQLTHEIGAVLIFDEVITGFRVGLGGAQALYGFTPDLTCFGKIIGGGFPAAAFGGKREIMDNLAPLGSVYQAGTLSGSPVAMVAGYHTIHLLEQPGIYGLLEASADKIIIPVQEKLKKGNHNACIQRAGSMFTLFFGRREVKNMDEAKECGGDSFARFFRYLFANGVYIPPAQHEVWFVSTVHTDEHLKRTRDLILAYFD